MKNPGPAVVYVVEANGMALVAFEAFRRIEAQELPREKWFREELQSLRSETRQIWDGKARLTVRAAEQNEITEFRSTQTEVHHREADGLLLAYLIPLDGAV